MGKPATKRYSRALVQLLQRVHTARNVDDASVRDRMIRCHNAAATFTRIASNDHEPRRQRRAITAARTMLEQSRNIRTCSSAVTAVLP